MNYKHLLIVTYGRTGSTLLQGLLNSIDGCLIRGENFNFCYGLFKSYQATADVIDKQGKNGGSVTKPFYGSAFFNKQQFLKDSYLTLKNQLAIDKDVDTVDCWGFKEIRYTPGALKNGNYYLLKEYLDFLNKLLPGLGVIFLTREHTSVLKSAFWQNKEANKALQEILEFERQAKDWSETNSNSFWIDYADIVQVNDDLEKLYDFIGAQFNESSILKVLNVEHSYGGKAENICRTEAVVAPKTTEYPIKILQASILFNSFVEYAFIDSEQTIAQNFGEKIEVRGGIILKDIYKTNEFELTSNTPHTSIHWGIASPIMAEKYINNPNAIKARFKIIISDFDLNKEFILSIKGRNGESKPVVIIKESD
jgi:hypothetical protein